MKQPGQSTVNLCLLCESISLILLYIILAFATIYVAGARQDIFNWNIDIDTTSLIICIVFVTFSGFLLVLCIYHMRQNHKTQQPQQKNGYHSPNKPAQTVIPFEDEAEPITKRSDYKQQIITINQLTSNNETLKNENRQLTKLLKSRRQQENDVSKLTKELEEYKTQVDQLKQYHQEQSTIHQEKRQLLEQSKLRVEQQSETVKQQYILKEDEINQTIGKLKQELGLKQTTIQAMQNKHDEMKEQMNILQVQLETASQIKLEQELIVKGNQSQKVLKTEYDALLKQNDAMERRINGMMDQQNEIQSLNDQLLQHKEAELANQKILASKQSEIDEIQKRMDSLNATLTQLQNENMKLKRELMDLQRAYDELDEFKKALQNRLCDLNENTISLNENFPTVEDIIIKYDTLRGQDRPNCAKKIKRYFKKKPENKKVNKKWLSKQANQLLFQMLMTSHKKMQNYYITVNKQFANDKMDGMNKVVYHKLRQQFESLFEKIKIKYSNEIVANAIEQEYKDLYTECQKESLVKYVEGCLYVCWFINVSRSPTLTLYPIKYDNEENNDDFKETINEEILKKNEDNKDLYEYVAGSNEDEKLNYYVWPAIIRTDNNFALTRIYAFYMNNIPKTK